jgi:dihydrofolate synthase/folylpolyglutamate synthase
MSSDVFVFGEDFTAAFKSFDGINQEIDFSAELLGVSMLCGLRLLGSHQIQNCALAVMTTLILANNDERITAENIHNALLTVSWQGRFEILELKGRKIIIDGAHNPAGAAILRKNLNQYFPNKKIKFLLGILKDKDFDAIIASLVYAHDSVIVTEPESERAAAAEFIAAKITAAEVTAMPSISDGIDELIKDDTDSVLCVAGSLYLIGRARSLLVKLGAAAFE